MRKHKYSEAQLVAFERAMGVTLPDSYKRYLREVGAGELDHSEGISHLEDWAQPDGPEDLPPDYLRQEFPHGTSWNDPSLLDDQPGWSASYFDRMLCRGSMRIKNRGCEDYYLLIVSGPERGNVWCDERVGSAKGIHPLQRVGKDRVTIDEYLRDR